MVRLEPRRPSWFGRVLLKTGLHERCEVLERTESQCPCASFLALFSFQNMWLMTEIAHLDLRDGERTADGFGAGEVRVSIDRHDAGVVHATRR
jgi:hypothetical protein